MSPNGPWGDRRHRGAEGLDYVTPMEGLLSAFRQGAFADPERSVESAAIERHLSTLAEAWERVFPGFPPMPWKRRTVRWEYHRGLRDRYLVDLLVSLLRGAEPSGRLVVNPVCVFGRHARRIARELPDWRIVGSDIDPTWDRLYRLAHLGWSGSPANYEFRSENVFEQTLGESPTAVTFFGACGSLTDGCMKYALAVRAPVLVCRSCCHDNLGGNTSIVRRPGALNTSFRLKNRMGAWAQKQPRYDGYYRDDRFGIETYPQSTVGRELMDSDTVLELARHATDSDICRSIVDLDRCLLLREHGYDVYYREECFVALARRPRSGP